MTRGLSTVTPRGKGAILQNEIQQFISRCSNIIPLALCTSSFRNPTHHQSASCILRWLQRYKTPPGRLLVAGHPGGEFLEEALGFGWTVEPMEGQIPISLERLPVGQFDAAVLLGVVEDLPNPKETLIGLRRLLAPHGVLYLSRSSQRGPASPPGSETGSDLLEVAGFDTLSVRRRMREPIEVMARRARRISLLSEWETPPPVLPPEKCKVVAVLPAYNAAETLPQTVRDIPKEAVDRIILVDDASQDNTVAIAERLGLTVVQHLHNRGYGGNQKTCYTTALDQGADIIVMVHPDYQYDPKIIPQLIAPIREGRADAVFGSRMMRGGALEGGMPLWKHNCNILLTALLNVAFCTYLTEYHSGFRAYRADILCSIPFERNSNNFVFDVQIVAQLLTASCRIEEIPIRTRYFDEASVIRIGPAMWYGLSILWTMLRVWLHRKGVRQRWLMPIPTPHRILR